MARPDLLLLELVNINWGYIGRMEKRMETTIWGLVFGIITTSPEASADTCQHWRIK